MLNHKMLTADAVRRVAERLMRTHGTTTPREVRDALRRQGFWAVADDVAYLMEHLAQEQCWLIRERGDGRRLYGLPAPALCTPEFFLAMMTTSADAEERRFWGLQYAHTHRN